jgi:hypothetical protein
MVVVSKMGYSNTDLGQCGLSVKALAKIHGLGSPAQQHHAGTHSGVSHKGTSPALMMLVLDLATTMAAI